LFFNRWVEAGRKNITRGDGIVVRVADDSVVGLDPREDADRFLVDLQARFQPFGLEAQPNNTLLIACGPHGIANRKPRGEGKPETFDILDFTHICEKHRKPADFIV
jgi:hypothetical protein